MSSNRLIGFIVFVFLIGSQAGLAGASLFDCAAATDQPYFSDPFTMTIDGKELTIHAKGSQEAYQDVGIYRGPKGSFVNGWTEYNNNRTEIGTVFLSPKFKSEGGLMRFLGHSYRYETYRCMKQ